MLNPWPIIRPFVLLLGVLLSVGCRVTPSGELGYKPPFLPVQFTIDTLGAISASGDASVTTPLGQFSIGGSVALETDDESLLLIIRDRRHDPGKTDTVYRIPTNGAEVKVVLDGKTTVEVTSKRMVVDVTDGNVQAITVTGDLPAAETKQGSVSKIPPRMTPSPPAFNPQLVKTIIAFYKNHERVNDVTFSPDGQTLASAQWWGGELWNVSDGTFLRSLNRPGYDGGTNDSRIVFSPDGQLLATGSGQMDGMVRLWNVHDGRLVRTIEAHEEGDVVKAVAFSPDGQLLASGSGDGTVKLWLVADGSLIRTMTGHTDGVVSVGFGPGGDTLISASWDTTIKVWRAMDGKLLRTLEGHTAMIRDMALTRDRHLLVSGSDDTTVRLWRVSDGTLLHTLDFDQTVWSVAVASLGQTIAAGASDGTLRFWNLNNGNGVVEKTLKEHTSYIRGIEFARDGKLLASASEDGTIKLWTISGEPSTGKEKHKSCGCH
jgi:WD40 repeat protein